MDIIKFIYLYLLICTLIEIYNIVSAMKVAKEINIDIKNTKSFGKILPALFELPFQVPMTLILIIYKLLILVILFINPDYVLIVKKEIEYTIESTKYASETDKKLEAALLKKVFCQKYTE